MKITIIFPGRSLETAKSSAPLMPLAPCLLAALTPDKHEVSLVDMFFGDEVDYESNADVIAITVRTPRILSDRAWDDYGTGRIVYRHPTMSEKEMFERNAEVMTEGYSTKRILKRTFQAVRNRPSLNVAKDSFFTQLGVRKAYRHLYQQVLQPLAR